MNPDSFFAHTKFLFPSLDGETLESLNVYFDVSGSISEKLFAYYLNILSSILNETGFQGNFNLFQFDTRILTLPDKANIEVGTVPKMIHGGGTCYKCIGKQDQKTPSALTLIFTDGLCSDFPENEIQNCVWIVLTPIGFKVAPFGKKIQVY
jgi:predicted metal-dependent peptidase